jgi:hypothetical protein
MRIVRITRITRISNLAFRIWNYREACAEEDSEFGISNLELRVQRIPNLRFGAASRGGHNSKSEIQIRNSKSKSEIQNQEILIKKSEDSEDSEDNEDNEDFEFGISNLELRAPSAENNVNYEAGTAGRWKKSLPGCSRGQSNSKFEIRNSKFEIPSNDIKVNLFRSNSFRSAHGYEQPI